MPRSVSILAGNYNVELPNGISYSATYATTTAGPTVILTDEEFARVGAVGDGTGLQDNGNVGTSVVTTHAANTANPTSQTSVTTGVAFTAGTFGFTTTTQGTAVATELAAAVVDIGHLYTALDALLVALQVPGGPQAAA